MLHWVGQISSQLCKAGGRPLYVSNCFSRPSQLTCNLINPSVSVSVYTSIFRHSHLLCHLFTLWVMHDYLYFSFSITCRPLIGEESSFWVKLTPSLHGKSNSSIQLFSFPLSIVGSESKAVFPLALGSQQSSQTPSYYKNSSHFL